MRDALKAAGVSEDRIVLKKPESITGGTNAKKARRVEAWKSVHVDRARFIRRVKATEAPA
ncbi:MAG: Cytochrome c oxidase polypeptide II (EC [uncultured Caballeronia sp.]|nr:MAG: Cytochrome c oxidase polypeptide II (EC [uncultured Caballeronia sp.]